MLIGILGVIGICILSLCKWSAVTCEAAVGSIDISNCVLCKGLKYCTAMNGKLLHDPVIGYTRGASGQLSKQGVCEDLDAKTLALSKFGTSYQYKNTSVCHTLVWNFHCLSWVATAFTQKWDSVPIACGSTFLASQKPLPPCRSLCVEVADKCVYSHYYQLYLEEVCGNIPCVTEFDELISNHTIKQQPCVQGEWEKEPNSIFQRCSIRAYEPPRAIAYVLHSNIFIVVMLALLQY